VRLKSILTAVVMIAVTVGLLAYSLAGVGVSQLLQVMAGGNYWVLIPYQVALVVFFATTGWRWQLILRPIGRFSFAQVVPPMMIGFAGNNLLPARMGELIRTTVFAARHGCSRSAVLTTLVVERVLDVLAVLLLYVIAVIGVRPVPTGITAGFWSAWILIAGFAVLATLLLRHPESVIGLWERASQPLPAKLRHGVTRTLRGIVSGVQGLKEPRLVALMLFHSFAKWAASATMVWLSIWCYGLAMNPLLSLVAIAVTALAVTLPSVPGFFGVVQAAFVVALTPFGVAQEIALAGSVLFLLAQWVPVKASGVLFFLFTGARVWRVREAIA